MSLQDALKSLGNNFEKQADELANNKFVHNRQSWTNSVVESYVKYNVDPNTSIAKIAKENDLNDEQVNRIIEETNISIYLQKYAATKGQRVRRVTFPLADPTKIGVMSKSAQHTTSEDTAKLDKAASDNVYPREMDFSIDKEAGYSMLTSNSTNYEPAIWDKELVFKQATETMKNKIKQRMEQEKIARIQSLKSILHKVAFIGDAIIYNARSSQDTQGLFNSISKEASLDSTAQNAIIKYTTEKIASMKEERFLPGNFDFQLQLATTGENKFSLGKHSLSKYAEDIQLQKDLVLPNVTDYEKLIGTAIQIQKELNALPVEKTISTSN